MSSLNPKLKLLDDKLNILFDRLSNYSPEQLNQKQDPGSWSAIQIMHHLMMSESYSRIYCEKKLNSGSEFRKSGISSHLRGLLLRWFLLSGLKAKAPPRVNTEFLPVTDSLDHVKEKWLSQRNELGIWLESVPNRHLDKAIYRHPYAGHLTIPGMIDFFYEHFLHHRPQIIRSVEHKSIV